MKMIVLKKEEGRQVYAIIAEEYRVKEGFVEARGNIRAASEVSHDIKGNPVLGGSKGVALEHPTTKFEVPISNVALIVNL